MYSDIFIQKVNVLIGFFSLTTLTMHFGIWGVDHGMKGFFSSLHLITWGEGIYTIVIFSAKKIKVRITSVNSFVIILFGTRYLLTNFAKIGYHFVLSKSCIDAGITGNYNIDSTITILFALLTYALSTVMLQLIMSGMVQFCFKSFYFNPYNNNNKKNNTFNVVPYKLSRFEQMTGQNFSCVYGFAPVSHHQLLIKGVAYTPLEWVLTSGYFLYQGYLYETNLRTSLWFLTNKQIGCIQAIPIAEYINGTLQEIKQKVDDDDHVKNDTNAYNQMEIGMTKTEPKKCESNLSNTKGPFTSKTELYKPRNKAQEGFIFTPL
jgi:hypothetical protein